MTVATVKSVQADGTWESKYGLMYSFEYQLDNGVVFKANHKTDEPIPAGEKVEYEIKKENQYGKLGKIKRHFPESGEVFGKNDSGYYRKDDGVKGIKIGHAINNAVILCGQIGNIETPSGKLGLKDSIKEYAKLIYDISEELNREIGSNPEKEVKPSGPAPTPPVEQDLPF